MCRLCCAPLRHTLVDLGMIPLCQSYIEEKDLDRGEMFYGKTIIAIQWLKGPLESRPC